MILVVGGDSKIGSAVTGALRAKGATVMATSRRPDAAARGMVKLDLADPPDAWSLPPCEAAVICAAKTRLAECEAEAELARRVNVEAPTHLAARLHDKEAYLLLLSTNLVFDGMRELPAAQDAVGPLTAYGQMKAEAEQAVAGATKGHCGVLRMTKVFGRGDERLCGWRDALRQGKTVEAFSDVPLAPVGLEAVVRGVCRVIEARAAGVFHLSARQDVRWAEVAERVAELCGAETRLVKRVSAVPAGHATPRHSALGMGRDEAQLGMVPQDPWIAVKEALG